MTKRRVTLLQGMPIFGGINEAVLEYLLQFARVVERPAGSYFFREGEPGDSMFVLERGVVDIVKNWGVHTYLLRRLETGDCFGILTLMDLGPRSGSAIANKDCSAIEISSTNVLEIYRKDKDQFTMLQMNLSREVSRRLRDADTQLFKTLVAPVGAERDWMAADIYDIPAVDTPS